MITEFVVDRVEQSFDSSFDTSGAAVGLAVATLPSIDDFVRSDSAQSAAESGAATSQDEFVSRTSRSPWGTYEASHAGAEAADEPVPASASLEPDLHPTESHTPPAGSEDAVVNEIVEPAEAWAASAAGGEAATPSPERDESAAKTSEPVSAGAAQPAPEVWVDEERDAFDWNAVASLTVPPAEEQRAAEEWSSTEWERSSGSVQDHVATLLAQVSRRIRAGELEVQGSKQMGAEAALVAVLGALLAESAKKKS
jgi:hypothetical protein